MHLRLHDLSQFCVCRFSFLKALGADLLRIFERFGFARGWEKLTTLLHHANLFNHHIHHQKPHSFAVSEIEKKKNCNQNFRDSWWFIKNYYFFRQDFQKSHKTLFSDSRPARWCLKYDVNSRWIWRGELFPKKETK